VSRVLAYQVYCYYNILVATWDEAKRQRNIKDHGLVFVGCEAIWDKFTITREDIRESYGEKRLVTFGLLEGNAVVMVHTERRAGSHIISIRKAEKHEARYYFEIAKDYFK
jgi:uncharacterized DUF497 family protein